MENQLITDDIQSTSVNHYITCSDGDSGEIKREFEQVYIKMKDEPEMEMVENEDPMERYNIDLPMENKELAFKLLDCDRDCLDIEERNKGRMAGEQNTENHLISEDIQNISLKYQVIGDDIVKMEKEYKQEDITVNNELEVKIKGNEDPVEIDDLELLENKELDIKLQEVNSDRFEYGVEIPPPEVTTRLSVRLKRLMPNFNGDQSCIKNKSTRQRLRNSHQQQRKSCLCGTGRNCNLKGHFFGHKNPSEITMYRCNSCSFQSKYKNALRSHIRLHKDPSEVIMYSCASCSFQTKHKGCLKAHVLLHKDPSKVIMYKCKYCPFQTKQKRNLGRHAVTHKGSTEVIMYSCDSCSYQTKRKPNLKRHVLVHKDPSEVIMYKCGSCPFQTKQKSNLGIHVVIHKHPSEVIMYDCDSCSYQTKHKCALKRHVLVHKDPSEVMM